VLEQVVGIVLHRSTIQVVVARDEVAESKLRSPLIADEAHLLLNDGEYGAYLEQLFLGRPTSICCSLHLFDNGPHLCQGDNVNILMIEIL